MVMVSTVIIVLAAEVVFKKVMLLPETMDSAAGSKPVSVIFT